MTTSTTTAAAATPVAASQQPNTATTAAPSGIIAVVKENAPADKEGSPTFTCVVDGVTVGTSKHRDYFEFHKRRGDIVSLNKLNIGKFVYVDAADQVVETKKIEGVPAPRASVQRAIALAKNPAPAPVGFNNQTHAQAQENGRKGAMARLKNVSGGGDRPNAQAADSNTSKPTANAGSRSTVRGQATGTKDGASRQSKGTAKADAPSAQADTDAKAKACEYGRLGAQRAAEKRAAAAAGSDKATASAAQPVKRGPGRPRKVREAATA